MIIVIVIFSAFLFLVIHKDFYGVTSIIIDSSDEKTNCGTLRVDTASNWASFFVDFATLPLLIITILFSAHGSFNNSQFQKEEINKLVEIQRDVSRFRVELAENHEDTISFHDGYTKDLHTVVMDKPINSVNIDKLENTETDE